MTYIFGDLGRCWSIFRDLGSKDKILLGRQLFSGIWGDQCIVFRDQGSTDPPGGLYAVYNILKSVAYAEITHQKRTADFWKFLHMAKNDYRDILSAEKTCPYLPDCVIYVPPSYWKLILFWYHIEPLKENLPNIVFVGFMATWFFAASPINLSVSVKAT